MAIFGYREAKFHNLDYVPSTSPRTNYTLPAKLGQSEHIESKNCCAYDRKGQGEAAAYRNIHLD